MYGTIPTNQEILIGTAEILHKTLTIDDKEITMHALLHDDLDAQGEDLIYIISELGKRFHVDIDIRALLFGQCLTYGNLVEYVQQSFGLVNHYAQQRNNPAPNFFLIPTNFSGPEFSGIGCQLVDARVFGRGVLEPWHAETRAVIYDPRESSTLEDAYFQRVTTSSRTCIHPLIFERPESRHGQARCIDVLQDFADHLGRNYGLRNDTP